MKKLIFIMLSLGLFLVSAEARCYIKPQYPGSGPAPKAYCWDVAYVASEQYPYWEDTRYKSSTSQNHGSKFIVTKVDVYGYGDNTNVDINYQDMKLHSTQNIINEYKIIVGKRYLYIKNPNNLSSGMIRVKDYSSVKDQLYVR